MAKKKRHLSVVPIQPENLADKAREDFVKHVYHHGVGRPTSKILLIQEALDASGETDCWTHAYEYAVANNIHYVEGVCVRTVAGQNRVQVHAWAERPSPFGAGTVIVELTKGYEDAHSYIGCRIPVDCDQAQRATLDGVRYSVLELCFASGIPIPTH